MNKQVYISVQNNSMIDQVVPSNAFETPRYDTHCLTFSIYLFCEDKFASVNGMGEGDTLGLSRKATIYYLRVALHIFIITI
jgi:hypothetical protein